MRRKKFPRRRRRRPYCFLAIMRPPTRMFLPWRTEPAVRLVEKPTSKKGYGRLAMNLTSIQRNNNYSATSGRAEKNPQIQKYLIASMFISCFIKEGRTSKESATVKSKSYLLIGIHICIYHGPLRAILGNIMWRECALRK